MRRRFTCLAGIAMFALLPMPGTAAEAPAGLQGAWAREEMGCGSGKAAYDLAPDAMIMAGSRCPYTGVRQLHASRWYLDAACPDGTLVQLDINRLSADRLLIAQRPLGEAGIYLRCQP